MVTPSVPRLVTGQSAAFCAETGSCPRCDTGAGDRQDATDQRNRQPGEESPAQP